MSNRRAEQTENRVQIIAAGLAADMTYTQIAAQIGVTKSTVAGIIHRHLRGVEHMPAPVETEAAIADEVVSDAAEPAAEPLVSDLGFPVLGEMKISHDLGDFELVLCTLVGRDGETEIYRGRYLDEQSRATPSLRDASVVADGKDDDGRRVVVIRDVDIQIKKHRHPWFHIHVSPRDVVDFTLISGPVAGQEAFVSIVRQIDELPIDGSVVSVAVPNGTNLTPLGDYVIGSFPNRIIFARRDRSAHEAVRRIVSAVRTSETMQTSVILTSNGTTTVLRDVSAEIYSEDRDVGLTVRLQPHRDVQALMDARQQIKTKVIDDEDLRDAYQAARRSEGYIRRSRLDVGIDKVIDLAQRRGVVGRRTMDDIDAHFDRLCSPIIEKHRERREKQRQKREQAGR